MAGLSLARFLNRHLSLLVLGACSELLYLLYFVRHFSLLTYYRSDVDMGGITGHSTGGFWSFVLTVTVLFVLFAAAWWVAHDIAEQGTLWVVIGLGALFGLTMTFVYPITAIDIFAYVDQSLVMVHYHQNPIFTPPAAFPNDPIMSLSGDWRGSGSPYGPLALVVDAIPAVFVGHNLLANLILLKLMFSAMTIGCALCVYQILRARLALAVSGALLVAWNPLIVFEVSANGHNDIIMMFLAMLALLSTLEGDLTLGPLLLVASALVKYTTLVLLPLFLLYGMVRRPSWRARLSYLAMTLPLCAALAVIIYFPFWQGTDTLRGVLSQNQRYLVSFSSVLAGAGVVNVDVAATLGRVLFLAGYLYAVWLVVRGAELALACFLAMFGLVVLGLTNFETWYGIWPALLAAAVPRFAVRAAVILFSYGTTLVAAFFGYIWVWMGLGTPGSFTLINNVSYLTAFLPAVVVLVVFSVIKRRMWGPMEALGAG